MLLGLQLVELEGLAFIERGQFVGERFVVFVFFIFRFFVDFEEAVELQHRSGYAEVVVAVGFGDDVDGRLVEDCRRHLRGDEALPDELVEFVLLVAEIATYLVGMMIGVGRANRFVCVLRVLL